MRRKDTVIIPMAGRDQGKSFTIEEMPAAQAEEWFTRALMLIMRGGLEVPDNILNQGTLGFSMLAIVSITTGFGKAPWPEVKQLLDEMFDSCVLSYNPPSGVAVTGRSMIMSQLEEVASIYWIRDRIVALHTGFLLSAWMSHFLDEGAKMISTNGENTPTSQPPSESPSAIS